MNKHSTLITDALTIHPLRGANTTPVPSGDEAGEDRIITAIPQGFDRGGSASGPTSTTVEDRSAAERDEWATAGEIASGLERARVALALAAARTNYAAAEGYEYE